MRESKDPAVRASARSVAGLTDAKDALLPMGQAAANGELPGFLVAPPWASGRKSLKFKPQSLATIEHKDHFELAEGSVLDREPSLWPKGKAKVIERLSSKSYWYADVGIDSLTQLSEEEFDKHVVANAHRISGRDVGLVHEKFGDERTIALLLARPMSESVPALAWANCAVVAPRMAEAYSL